MRCRALILVVAAVASMAHAQIPVTDDAFTSSAAPAANYGVSLGLVVQSPAATGIMTSPAETAGYTANTYLKFDLSALPPNLTPANLAKANLRLYVDFVVSPGKFDVYLAGGSWSEGTLTANNAPGRIGTPIASSVSVTNALKYIDIDVTSAFANGSPTNGLVLVPSPGSNIFVSFDSKENPLTSHDPELSIAVNDASSVQLQQEITRATQAENAITTNLANEVVRAQGAEGALSNGLNNEIANRIAGDNAGKAYTDASVGAEAALRGAADTTLQGNINSLQNSLTGYAQLAAANKFIANQTIDADLTTKNLNASGQLTAGGGAILPPTGSATPLQAFPSNPFDLAASVSDGASSHNETFRWQSVPVNNGSPNFAAQLSLQYGGGVGPSPTGFSFNSDGTLNFVPSQKFTGDGSGLVHVNADSANTANSAASAGVANNALMLGGLPASSFAQPSLANNFTASQTITGNLNIGGSGNGITFPDGSTQTTALTAGSGGGSPSSSSVLPAFLPGPLTTAYTAASFIPDSSVTVTRISAALKTAPDPNCAPAVLRVSAGNSGQDLDLVGGQSVNDSGPMSLPLNAGANLKVAVQIPANCLQTNPTDANVLVEYRGRQGSDQATCAESGLVCNGICEETQVDPNNCGSCGNVCTPANGAGGCVSGQCTVRSCNGGFGDCDDNAANGCEANLTTDAHNCGACGTDCTGPNTTSATCITSFGTFCSISCQPGFANCTPFGQQTGGCPINLNTNNNNCGACGSVCSVTGAGGFAFCFNGVCERGCGSASGVKLCGAACVQILTDPNNCGACGHVCPTDAHTNSTCSGGLCVTTCVNGATTCNGTCVNLQNDTKNCGACGNVCPTGTQCFTQGFGTPIDCNSGQCYAGFCTGQAVSVCTNSACLAGSGTSCTSGSQCASGVCSNGTCN